MPNHVHLLLTPLAQLSSSTQFIKGRSARQANLILHRQGKTFWQKESFDHWVRDYKEFDRILGYIRNNPVKAKLVTTPDAWPWLMPKTWPRLCSVRFSLREFSPLPQIPRASDRAHLIIQSGTPVPPLYGRPPSRM